MLSAEKNYPCLSSSEMAIKAASDLKLNDLKLNDWDRARVLESRDFMFAIKFD